METSDLMSVAPHDPRRVGGTYWSAYWGQRYTVVATAVDSIGTVWFRVRWADGEESTHCTGWSPRDAVVEP